MLRYLLPLLLLPSIANGALVAHWKLDDNAASTTVVATVGSNGTLLGGDNTSAKRVTGPGGSIPYGLAFNGVDDCIQISITTAATFSISFWYKYQGSSGVLVGVMGVQSGLSPKILILTDGQWQYQGNGGPLRQFTAPTMDANWHHLLVAGGEKPKLYIDGVERSVVIDDSVAQATFTRIGRRDSLFFNGHLAQVKIFNSNESANVASLYAEGVGGGGTIVPILQFYLNRMGVLYRSSSGRIIALPSIVRSPYSLGVR